MKTVSVVIPHFNRHEMLFRTLREFENQVYKNFEVIVVDDWSYPAMPEAPRTNYPLRVVDNLMKGPARARNYGAELAIGDVVLFIGDDCIPDNDLVFQHALWHHNTPEPISVQGYSPFHPQIFDNPFMWWLEKSGLQANWEVLRNKDGSAKHSATGYCLTTNFSINRGLFLESGGFSTEFPGAAWEDVAYGYHLVRIGAETVFNPSARNWHYHGYNPETFAKRQFMVGESLITMLELHPELARGHFDPKQYKEFTSLDLDYMVTGAMDLFHSSSAQLIIENADKIWGKMLHTSMQYGIKNRIEGDNFYWVLPHLENIEHPKHVFEIVNGMKVDNYGWVSHNINWLLGNKNENAAIWAFIGDVYRHYGMRPDALNAYRTCLEISPLERAKRGIEEIL